MKDGDFIRIDYIAKIKESGQIFDLTDEKIARENEIYDPKVKYDPIPVIIGAGFTIRGLESQLRTMKVGEKKKFSVKSEDAFGKRSEKLIKLIPISEFHKHNMVPYPGMPVNINNLMGRVLSVSGGRVKVDFNHPLAGKELEYQVEIKEMITDQKEQVEAVVEFFHQSSKGVEISIDKKEIEIKIMETEIQKKTRERIADTILRWVKNIEKVRFIEEYTSERVTEKKTD